MITMISNNISLHIAYKEGDKVKCRLSKTTEKKLNELLRDNNLEELEDQERMMIEYLQEWYPEFMETVSKKELLIMLGSRGSKSSL